MDRLFVDVSSVCINGEGPYWKESDKTLVPILYFGDKHTSAGNKKERERINNNFKKIK